MNVSDTDLGCLLLCDVCEGEITIFDDTADCGCCSACGVAYAFDHDDLRQLTA